MSLIILIYFIPDLQFEDHGDQHVQDLVLQEEVSDLYKLFDLWHHSQLLNQPDRK